MPEDPSFNGGRWNNEASKLFAKMGWEKIGDSNIDVEGTDGHQHGLDSVFRYEITPGFGWEGIFAEAKYYSKKSFQMGKLQDWIKTINQKMLEIKRSDDFYQRFPTLKEGNTQLRNGILAIWIHDLNGDLGFHEDFRSAMRAVSVPHGRGIPGRINRMFVVGNEAILRICSLIDTLKDYKHEAGLEENNVSFWYPATKTSPAISSKILTIELVFSKFVLAKAKALNTRFGERNLVMYNGPRDYDSYLKLREALLLYQFVDNQVPLTIFNYQDDEDFRKIKPDVEKLYKAAGYPDVEFRGMTKFAGLPTWMKDETR